MSFTTWTPTEVGSNSGRLQCALWRPVEAQHCVSTIALVDTLSEQALLGHFRSHNNNLPIWATASLFAIRRRRIEG